jgi:aerobic-type carbon monoxide dehydrogenase small subunit (CoxS/CutS family)
VNKKKLVINGATKTLVVEPQATLLDVLHKQLMVCVQGVNRVGS